jgi:hypothetical protein
MPNSAVYENHRKGFMELFRFFAVPCPGKLEVLRTSIEGIE